MDQIRKRILLTSKAPPFPFPKAPAKKPFLATMARIIGNAYGKSITYPKFFSNNSIVQLISAFLDQDRFTHSHSSSQPFAPPFDSNILRILRKEIDYHSEYAPPHQPPKNFNGFTVEDRPGERWIKLRGKYAHDEHIKIEATMFDGSVNVPKSDDDSVGVDVRLHISVLVDIWKGGGGAGMIEFVCSAWPDSLEIQKVYIFQGDGGSQVRPYMGPNVKDLKGKLRDGFYGFLEARGVNDGLSEFLHEYMMNKDKIEFIHWLRRIHSCF